MLFNLYIWKEGIWVITRKTKRTHRKKEERCPAKERIGVVLCYDICKFRTHVCLFQNHTLFILVLLKRKMLLFLQNQIIYFGQKKMVPKLKQFYYKCMLPELIDPRRKRGLEIRNPSREDDTDEDLM